MNRISAAVLVLVSISLSALPGLARAQERGKADPKLELLVQTGHTDSITSLSLSADGRRLVTGAGGDSAILWDVESGQKLRTFSVGEDAGSVALSADGKQLATGKHATSLWDTTTGKMLRTFPKDDYVVNDLARTKDGKRLVGARGEKVVLWDLESGMEARTFSSHSSTVTGVALSSDGRQLATSSWDKTAIVWDMESGKKLRVFSGHTEEVDCVALSSDGKHLVTGSRDKTAILWNVESGKKLRSFDHSEEVHAVALSSDGKRVFTGAGNKGILWDAVEGNKVLTFSAHTSSLTTLALSSDEKHLVTGSYDRTAILWDTQTGRKLRTFSARASQVNSVALSSDNKHLATGLGGEFFSKSRSSVVLWDTEKGKIQHVLSSDKTTGDSVALTSDGKRLVTIVGGGNAAIWDTASGKKIHTLGDSNPRKPVLRLGLSADGKRLATGSLDWATFWDIESGKELSTNEVYTPGTNLETVSVSLSADGKRMVTAKEFGYVILWDTEKDKKLQAFFAGPNGRPSRLSQVVLSADGRRLVTASLNTDDQTAILWDVESGKKLRTFSAHQDNVISVALSADGKQLVTGSWDKTAILWDMETGKRLRSFSGRHEKGVESVALSRDGKRLVTGSWDGTTGIWDTETEKLLCQLISIDEGKDWLVVSPDGLFDGTPDGMKLVNYRVEGTNELVPVERYFDTYYTPGLLSKVMKGEGTKAKVDVVKTLPPKVRITTPDKPSLETKTAELEVSAEAESVGEYPVTSMTLLVNGVPLRGKEVKFRESTLGKVKASWTVELPLGNHTLKAMANTELTAGASESISIRYLGGAAAKVALPKLYVVAVGITDYGDGDKYDLPEAAKDAKKITESYQVQQGQLYSEVQHRLLLDKQADQKAIRSALAWLRKEMTQNDYGVFLFCGHGVKGDDGALYLAGSDIDFKDVSSTGIPSQILTTQLRGTPGKLTVILDCCHAGAAESGTRKERNANDLTLDVLADLKREQSGIVTLCSALGSEKAEDGLFCQALREALVGKAVEVETEKGKRMLKVDANEDGVVYMEELKGFVVERVKHLSKGRQHATISTPIGFADHPVTKVIK